MNKSDMIIFAGVLILFAAVICVAAYREDKRIECRLTALKEHVDPAQLYLVC